MESILRESEIGRKEIHMEKSGGKTALPTGGSALFSPITFRSLALQNRIVVSPMCQYSAEHGQANEWHFIHLGTLAVSGAGMLVIEATAGEPEGRLTPRCPGPWDGATETPPAP